MSSTLLIVLTFLAVASLAGGLLMVVNDVLLCYRMQVSERIDELSGKTKSEVNAALFDQKLFAGATGSSRGSLMNWLSNLLEQAAIALTPFQFIGIGAGIGLVLAAAGWLATRQWWIVPITAPVGIVLPLFYASMRRSRRIRDTYKQLPEAFDCMARAVRAGQTIQAAFQLVADEFAAPLADDFWHCYEQQQLGIPFEAALRELARRSNVMEIRILVTALLVQVRSGGNLAEILTGLSTMARKRIKIQQRMRAMTGEGRMQANVLIVLPLVALGALTLMSPEYAGTLLQRPWLLAAMGAAELIGAIWIRQIVRPAF